MSIFPLVPEVPKGINIMIKAKRFIRHIINTVHRIFIEAHNDFCYLEKEILRKTMERCNQAQEMQPKNA